MSTETIHAVTNLVISYSIMIFVCTGCAAIVIGGFMSLCVMSRVLITSMENVYSLVFWGLVLIATISTFFIIAALGFEFFFTKLWPNMMELIKEANELYDHTVSNL